MPRAFASSAVPAMVGSAPLSALNSALENDQSPSSTWEQSSVRKYATVSNCRLMRAGFSRDCLSFVGFSMMKSTRISEASSSGPCGICRASLWPSLVYAPCSPCFTVNFTESSSMNGRRSYQEYPLKLLLARTNFMFRESASSGSSNAPSASKPPSALISGVTEIELHAKAIAIVRFRPLSSRLGTSTGCPCLTSTRRSMSLSNSGYCNSEYWSRHLMQTAFKYGTASGNSMPLALRR